MVANLSSPPAYRSHRIFALRYATAGHPDRARDLIELFDREVGARERLRPLVIAKEIHGEVHIGLKLCTTWMEDSLEAAYRVNGRRLHVSHDVQRGRCVHVTLDRTREWYLSDRLGRRIHLARRSGAP